MLIRIISEKEMPRVQKCREIGDFVLAKGGEGW